MRFGGVCAIAKTVRGGARGSRGRASRETDKLRSSDSSSGFRGTLLVSYGV